MTLLNLSRARASRVVALEDTEPTVAPEAVVQPRRRLDPTLALSFISVATLLFAWWLAAQLQLVNTLLLPSPTLVAQEGWRLLRQGSLLQDTLVSLGRVFLGFALAVIVALPLAAAMGMSRIAHRVIDPLVEIVRPIPPIAIIPLAILWFGIGEFSKVFVVAYAAFFPIVINSVAGFRSIDEIHLRAARCLGANRAQILTRVAIPSAFPHMVIGLRLGMGMAFLALVAAELIAASSGLGQLIQEARSQFATDRVMVGIVTVGVLGFSLNKALLWIESKIVRWR